MSTDLTTTFTPWELGRLERLRERFQDGRWPRPVRESSLSALYPVEMLFTRNSIEHGVTFDCLLMHSAPEHAMAPLRVRFQTARASDPSPTADEVLRWLAMGVSSVAGAESDHLETMFYVMRSMPADSWWRGPQIEASTVEQFTGIMRNYGVQIQQLLGPGSVAELVASLQDT